MSLSTVLSQKLPADNNMPTILIYFRYIRLQKSGLKKCFQERTYFLSEDLDSSWMMYKLVWSTHLIWCSYAYSNFQKFHKNMPQELASPSY